MNIGFILSYSVLFLSVSVLAVSECTLQVLNRGVCRNYQGILVLQEEWRRQMELL
jgi:hypothetical protein